MDWLNSYQLFLFDFDGLLVDTERLHYQSYIQMCAQRGYVLDWDFPTYSKAAHHTATALRDQIYQKFPRLYQEEPDWSVLYREKKQCLLKLIDTTEISLLPGVENFLKILEEKKIKRCVVTHSPRELVHKIREKNQKLSTLSFWITREDYQHPKPSAESYQLAIDTYALQEDSVIGFEDSPRGFKALAKTRAQPVLVCPRDSNYLPQLFQEHPDLRYYPDFLSLLKMLDE